MSYANDPTVQAIVPQQPARQIHLRPASEIEPLPVRWLWEGRIPIGEITLTPGLAGVGKSTFHAWLIAQITQGTLGGVYHGTPRNAIICAAEDSWQRSIVPRLMAAGADLDRVFQAEVRQLDTGRPSTVSLPQDLDELTEQISGGEIAVVSLDPLLSVVGDDIDTYKSREVRCALEPLREMADQTGCVILGNAHFNKATGADPLLRITGASAFGEVCRSALAFARDDDNDQFVISQAKNNLGRLNLPSLAYKLEETVIETKDGPSAVTNLIFVGDSKRTVKDLLGHRNHDPDDITQKDIATGVILDELQDGPKRWDEDLAPAVERQGVSGRTGRRARDELKRSGEIRTYPQQDGDKRRWMWELEQYDKNDPRAHPRGERGQVAKLDNFDPSENRTWPSDGHVNEPVLTATWPPGQDIYKHQGADHE